MLRFRLTLLKTAGGATDAYLVRRVFDPIRLTLLKTAGGATSSEESDSLAADTRLTLLKTAGGATGALVGQFVQLLTRLTLLKTAGGATVPVSNLDFYLGSVCEYRATFGGERLGARRPSSMVTFFL